MHGRGKPLSVPAAAGAQPRHTRWTRGRRCTNNGVEPIDRGRTRVLCPGPISNHLRIDGVRHRLKVIGWNICLILVLLIAVEVGLRYTSINNVRNPLTAAPAGYYVADKALGFRIARSFPESWFAFRGPGHRVFSNRFGCFDTPVRLAPGEPYILAIGDSFTWGYNPLEAKWTSAIERRSGVRVLKCGVLGTGTRYQLQHVRELLEALPHPPALVVHLYDTTDFNDDFTFPGEEMSGEHRRETFARIRLSDGLRVPIDDPGSEQSRKPVYARNKSFLGKHSILYNVAKLTLLADSRIEKRRLVIEGLEPTHLDWRYEFNLLLLDGEDYPYVSSKLDEHLATLRQMRDTVRSVGADYAVFHTNSFRLPTEKPLVFRLKQFLYGMPEFLGFMPELGRHPFDNHWSPESETVVGGLMYKRLKSRNLIPSVDSSETAERPRARSKAQITR